MRLNRLEIVGEYKSIRGDRENPFVYDFVDSHSNYSPLCLVGLNGSGKSNFIELIADIFGYVDRYYNNQYICKEDLTYDFEIDYSINDAGSYRSIKIIGRNSRLDMFTLVDSVIRDSIQSGYHQLLPSNIIAYSSGHNQGLSSVFAKSQFQYYEVIRKQAAFYRGFQQRYEAISGREDRSEQELSSYVRERYRANSNLFEVPRGIDDLDDYFDELDLGEPLTYKKANLPIGIFTDHSFNQLVFIYLLISNNQAFKHFISEEIKISHLCGFELDLRLSTYRDFEVVNDIASRLIELSADSLGLPAMGCPPTFNKDTLSGVLRFNLNHNFFSSFERLYLDTSIFLEHLVTLIQLSAKKWSSDECRSLKTSRYIRNVPNVSGGLAPIRFINTKIQLLEPNVETLYDRLSDGEHQLMQIIGSLIMFGEEESLFILDEPESHFNPEWRAEFLCLISKYTDLHNIELIISTHSPFVLSACKADRVLAFNKDEEGNVSVQSPGVETYGASFDSLLTSVFDLDVLISKKPKAEIERVIELQKLDQISRNEALERLEIYGDSFELNFRRNQLRRDASSQERGNE
ncbi:AAA family ATPase [uncultured Pseudoteredinibacter sp.]|uniref:AAA family ATPase n=1 Tax=uncultured Pseudoteredinibacter sp. TaxID=1641701 RepID=UPI002634445B|nr:AAA family ATPase [uncultured Pseudoteredinibacter sp.]